MLLNLRFWAFSAATTSARNRAGSGADASHPCACCLCCVQLQETGVRACVRTCDMTVSRDDAGRTNGKVIREEGKSRVEGLVQRGMLREERGVFIAAEVFIAAGGEGSVGAGLGRPRSHCKAEREEMGGERQI